jgi:hypothetical protein
MDDSLFQIFYSQASKPFATLKGHHHREYNLVQGYFPLQLDKKQNPKYYHQIVYNYHGRRIF